MESKLPATLETSDKALAARTRRGFITMGVAAVAGIGGWSWLRSRGQEDEAPWPFRRALAVNRRVAQAYFSDSHLAPVFSQDQVGEAQVNGDIGIEKELKPESWKLKVSGLAGDSLSLKMPEIMSLPRVEQVTQFKCIEGWSSIARWAGVKFTDFAAKYPPKDSKYVSLRTISILSDWISRARCTRRRCLRTS
jgi:DMSO/TMAO reductase YedYZ molybdopterin-dependent catalytic subunit